MQNFKTFLKEDSGNYPVLNIWTTMADEKIPANYIKQFKAAIDYHIVQKEGIKVEEVTTDAENFFVCIDLTRSNDIVKVNALVDIVRDICEGFGEIDGSIEDIFCHWPPAYPIKAPGWLVHIQILGETSSKDFAKNILAANTLEITHYPKYLTGLLGFMLLGKDVKHLSFDTSWNVDFQKAVAIVQKHLKSDRDVLECQEELITNGLKQYAKF
jgi:hypothetical protein